MGGHCAAGTRCCEGSKGVETSGMFVFLTLFALRVFGVLEFMYQSFITLEVGIQLCESVMAVRFPSAMCNEVRVGHHDVKRVDVDMVNPCTCTRRVTRRNPWYVAIKDQDYVCFCCGLVEAEAEPEGSTVGQRKTHVAAAGVEDTESGYRFRQLDQLCRVCVISTGVTCDNERVFCIDQSFCNF